jgi:cell division protein FtsN
MKIYYFSLIIMLTLTLGSCKSKQKISYTPTQNQFIEEGVSVANRVSEYDDQTVVVREEMVNKIENSSVVPLSESYFVITGSFKVLDNALKFQTQLQKEGFNSQLLQNDKGFYRVSVFSYNDINEARKKVLSTRQQYPKYSDTWLLRRSQ